MTENLAKIITHAIEIDKIFEEAKRQGMITMRQDGILKALRGIVPLEAVLKETQ